MKEKQEAWKLIFKIGEAMRNTHLRHEPKHKLPSITISQMKVMGCVIFNDGKPVKVKDIAEELGITPGGVSQLVDTLVKAGALERTVSEDDRRAVNISLSGHGKEIHRKMDLYFSELARELLSSVSPEKQEIFQEVLETMMKTLNEKKRTGGKADE